MLSLPPSVKLFVCTTPTDMRKQHLGLYNMVRSVFARDPMSGHLFVFFNRRRTMCKVLWWDRTGFALYSKRLAQGTFALPRADRFGRSCLEMSSADLSLILEGIRLDRAVRSKRYMHPESVRSF
jgi:transposase